MYWMIFRQKTRHMPSTKSHPRMCIDNGLLVWWYVSSWREMLSPVKLHQQMCQDWETLTTFTTASSSWYCRWVLRTTSIVGWIHFRSRHASLGETLYLSSVSVDLIVQTRVTTWWMRALHPGGEAIFRVTRIYSTETRVLHQLFEPIVIATWCPNVALMILSMFPLSRNKTCILVHLARVYNDFNMVLLTENNSS